MVSSSHPMPPSRRADNGGNFYLRRLGYSWGINSITLPRWRGQFTIGGPSNTGKPTPLTNGTNPTDAQQDALGTTAIARCEPTNPSFSMATSIGELRQEGLPSMIGIQSLERRTRLAQKAGKEYLNVEFGWLPLVRDLKQLSKTVIESEQILRQYHRDSGNKIRRQYHFPESSNMTWYVGPFFPQPLSMNNFITGTQFDQVQKEVWFSGAFKYHIPMPSDSTDKFQLWASNARKLYGLELTPEVVWNLSPWTWAGDWFANTGDLLHNVSALGRDGMVMQYGYVMNKSVLRTQRQGVYQGRSVSSTYNDTRLMRRRATPYGFGVDLNALSAKQTAILVALGLSR